MKKWFLFLLALTLAGGRGGFAQNNAVINPNFPSVINLPSSGVEVSAEVSRFVPGSQVEFIFKGITRLVFTKQLLTSASSRYVTTLSPAQFDDLGLEYYFEATSPTGVKTRSVTGYTYLYYTNGLPIGDLKTGSTVASYQLIAIPLNLVNGSVGAVLEDDLGAYDNRKWRLFGYQSGALQEYQGPEDARLDNFQAGRGYWFISKNPTLPNTGAGTTVRANSLQPYQMPLKQGWNLIGNPYNFNISWPQVKLFNRNPSGLGNLKIYEGGFLDAESDILPQFRGAYVFAERDLTIQIPVFKDEAINGRRAATEKPRHHPGSEWEVNFALRAREMDYRMGGVGMHPRAEVSKDEFDEITLPRFLQYLEINFDHPEYFAPHFTKDVVAVDEARSWTFTVASNLAPQTVELSWENYFSERADPDKQWMLYDEQRRQIIDLRKNKRYAFWLADSATFRLYYGSPAYVQPHLRPQRSTLGVNYPNSFGDPLGDPLNATTRIPFALPGDESAYEVDLGIYSLTGQRVASLVKGNYPPGAHEATWDGRAASGRRLPPGLYVCRMEVASANGQERLFRKILLR